MYQLKTAHVFYGARSYALHLTGLDNIEGLPEREQMLTALWPHMRGIGRDEIDSRMKIALVSKLVLGSGEVVFPEQIVVHGKGFNVTWTKEGQ